MTEKKFMFKLKKNLGSIKLTEGNVPFFFFIYLGPYFF